MAERGTRGRLAIVSLHAHRALAPRGERTRWLAEALGRDWDVQIVAPPPEVQTGGASGRGSSSRARRAAAAAVRKSLLDKWEPWSVRNLRRWRPEVDAAVLIGHPFSPVTYAARRLAAAGIPYTVDSGDPWVLTAPVTENAGISLVRARRAERFVWGHAAGGVLTTPQQAGGVNAHFPALPTLSRPNGYEPLGEPWPAPAPRHWRADGELRLVHLGMISGARLDLRPFLRALVASGRWRKVVFAQFGDDFAGMLAEPIDGVEVRRDRSYPWDEVIRRAGSYDLALVLGNRNPGQLPSKAVQYLTLPIPRAAITRGSAEDALATYVREQPGWLAVAPDDPAAAERVAGHVDRDWTPDELAPPESEAWPAVARTIADFVEGCVAR